MARIVRAILSKNFETVNNRRRDLAASFLFLLLFMGFKDRPV